MAIESKNLLVWVKAMSRGQALPLDASEIYESLAAAETYAGSATAYAGQTIKAKLEDGKYHSYVLQPSEAGYVLEEVGAVDESDLKQYVQVVDELPESGQIEGVLYIKKTTSGIENVDRYSDGYIWVSNAWKQVFWSVNDHLETLSGRVDSVDQELLEKAPIVNPVFTGTAKIGTEEIAVKSYVDGLISKLSANDVPIILNKEVYDTADLITEGKTYRVAEAGAYWGHECEPGDLIIVLKQFNNEGYDDSAPEGADGEDIRNDHADSVMVVQANIDGAVTSTADVTTVGEIVVFDSVTGKIIKGSGIQIASLNDAIAKAHEHANKAKLDTYDKTQAELLAAAKAEAQALVTAHETAVNTALADKANKATTLAGYGITDAYNKTEMDGKLKTITDNLNTKISGTEVDTKIATAKEETLEEAATAANEALELRVGNIPTDTTIQSYIDTAVGSGGTASAQAIAAAKQEAINTSNTYTDNTLNAALAIVEF